MDIRLKIQDAVTKIDHLNEVKGTSNLRYGQGEEYDEEIQLNLDEGEWLRRSRPEGIWYEEPSEIMIDYENDLQDNSAQEIEDIVGMNQSKDWVK